MARFLILILVFIAFTGCSMHQSHPVFRHPAPPKITEADYRIYTGSGIPSTLEAIAEKGIAADVVFFGEEHDDPAGHFLEKEVFRKLHEAAGKESGKKEPVILSMEMFERDVQGVVDEYLNGLITEHHFLKASRPWRNYWTAYRPMVEYARKKKLPVVAANAPGRYVNRVSRLGKAALNDVSAEAKKWLPPLPYGEASPAYHRKFKDFWEKNKSQKIPLKKTMKTTGVKSGKSPHSPKAPKTFSFDRLMDAQSLWDASMADSIRQSLNRHPEGIVFHINGKFHSEQGMGIPEHLKGYLPDAAVLTITQVSTPDFPEMPALLKGCGDFVIVTDSKKLQGIKAHIPKSSKNSDAGSTPLTSRESLARVQAT